MMVSKYGRVDNSRRTPTPRRAQRKRHIHPPQHPDYLTEYRLIQHGPGRLMKCTVQIGEVTLREVTVSQKAFILPKWFGRPLVDLTDAWEAKLGDDLPRFFCELMRFRKARAHQQQAVRGGHR
ncbi:MAG: hypothetical protein AAGJ10_14435 [Bacteroidota bacterium]